MAETASPTLSGTEPVLIITCRDVVMGRGQRTQNHCGNLTYRRLVQLQKEIYATSSKHDKLKISKAIVAAIRGLGGRFLQPIGEGNQGYSDIGDKKAWEKTSQALREGQVEVRAKLATEKETDQGKETLAKYAQVIRDESFLTYARDTLESQYDDSGLSLVCRERCSCRTINIDTPSPQSGECGPLDESSLGDEAAGMKELADDDIDTLSLHSAKWGSHDVYSHENEGAGAKELLREWGAQDACLLKDERAKSNELTDNSIHSVFSDAISHDEDIDSALILQVAKQDGEISTVNLAAATNSKSVSLKHWIKQALRFIGDDGKHAAASQTYLVAALKIAKSLADQIVEAEELFQQYGSTTKLDLLPTSQDWATYVTVQLRESGNFGIMDDELVSLPDNKKLESSEKGEEPVTQEPEFMHQSSLDAGKATEPEKRTTSMERSNAQGVGAKLEPPIDILDTQDSAHQADIANPSYFDIISAKIQCHNIEKCGKYNGSPAKESLRRMFYLGLVFYELFSGGEHPPSNLCDLALCDDAFVSLSTLTLSNTKNEEQPRDRNAKRHQGPSSSGGEVGLCGLSSEYLRSVGITSPICNLILNLLDCVYGDSSGNETYTNMTHLVSDLQLMIGNPFKFAQGLDMDKLSGSGLQIHDIEIPRDEELETLKSCYDRSKSGSLEVAIIEGESGSGKSWLAHRVGSYVISEGGVFLTGKFDQTHQSQPFSALASAFDQYCDLLLGVDDTGIFKSIVDNLKTALGQDAQLLFKVIPKLQIILGGTGESSRENGSPTPQDGGNSFFMLVHLVSKFVKVISTNVASMVLFMDDVQWIDEASLAILNRILRERQKKFLFLGCCRDNEMPEDHSFRKMITAIRALGVQAVQLKLNCMTEDTLSKVTSNALCLPPRLVKSFCHILYSRTKGNALFFMQLLILLSREGLLYLDFRQKRWAWNEEKILSMKLPDNIAICLANSLGKLSAEVQIALNVLSTFGASAKLSHLELLENQLGIIIVEPLKEAAAEGCVTNSSGTFRFCHDRIQDVALELITGLDNRSNCLSFGRCLVKEALETSDNNMLFTGVDLINRAGPLAISVDEDYYNMARYNMEAGKRAMSMAAFDTAFLLFQSGISFLRDGHWQSFHPFSIEIFELACKSAAATGGRHIKGLMVLSNQVLKNARSFEDTVEVQLINLSLLSYTNGTEALQLGLAVVSNLGDEIPDHSKEDLEDQINLMKTVLCDLSEDHLLNYMMMKDPKKLILMRFLSRIQYVAYHVKPLMNISVILKMLQITISYGLSSAAPHTFACFGAHLAWLGDFSEGYRYASLGKSLLTKVRVSEVPEESTGAVFAAVTTIQMHVQPSQAANEIYLEGANAAMSVGDLHFACVNRIIYCNNALWVGNDLCSVSEMFSKTRVFFEGLDRKISLAHNIIGHQLVLTISGKEDQAMVLRNLVMPNIDTIPKAKERLSFNDLYASYLMNRSNIIDCYEACFASKPETYLLSPQLWFQTFISGLAAYQVYRETGDSSWKDRGVMHTQELRVWAERASSWNFEHKLKLMQAEDCSCSGNIKKAIELYESAISSARAHKYINDEALSYELAGKFHLVTGNLTQSFEYLKQAHKRYSCWGAHGKAKQLFDFTDAKFAGHIESTRSS